MEEKEKEKGEEETSEVQKKQLVIKSKERIASFSCGEEGKTKRKKRKGRNSDKRTRTRRVLRKSVRWLCLFLLLGQN